MAQAQEIVVSICCITYNHVRFIEQCLNGFLMQKTDFPIEIIINDDASNDGTTEIIRKYAEEHPDLIHPVYHEENLYSQGIKGPFQRFVFPRARGKYVALCEGDDYWTDPCKLQKQVDFMESHPEYSLTCHPVQFLTMDGIEQWNYYLATLKPGPFTLDEFDIPTCSMMFRGSIIEKIPKHPDFQVGDVLFVKTCSLFGPFFCMDDEMGVYRRHQGGWTSQDSLVRQEITLKHFLAEREAFDDKRVIEVTDRQIMKAFSTIRHIHQWGAVKSMLMALKMLPARWWFVFFRKKFFS